MAQLAVFDLDRTLIAGSSAQVFGAKLRELGVDVPAPPGQGTYFSLYRRFGEDPVMMRIARHAARLFAGQSVATVQMAGRLAADVLSSDVLDPARIQLERHASEGTARVLATTAPREMAEPFAEHMGFDHVLSTHYRAVDGIYDGTNESTYLWGPAKAEAVAALAGEHGADLNKSSAYSDSWYDVPLLQLVGHPFAINADLRLKLYARSTGWTSMSWVD